MISDEVIMAEAIRLVSDGVKVTFPVNGRSMLPFIVGGRESVILERPTDLRRGDVVLARVENKVFQNNPYVVHRIVALDGDCVTLMGDGNLLLREHCNRNEVYAKATFVVGSDGKKHPLYSFSRRVASVIWYILLPIRKYLLWIYKKVKRYAN